MRPSENVEMPERAWAKRSGKRKAPGLLSTSTDIYTQARTHHAYHAALAGMSTAV